MTSRESSFLKHKSFLEYGGKIGVKNLLHVNLLNELFLIFYKANRIKKILLSKKGEGKYALKFNFL